MQVQSLSWEDPLDEGLAATPASLPGESHGQRSLEGCSPEGRKDSDTKEATSHKCTKNSLVSQALLAY